MRLLQRCRKLPSHCRITHANKQDQMENGDVSDEGASSSEAVDLPASPPADICFDFVSFGDKFGMTVPNSQDTAENGHEQDLDMNLDDDTVSGLKEISEDATAVAMEGVVESDLVEQKIKEHGTPAWQQSEDLAVLDSQDGTVSPRLIPVRLEVRVPEMSPEKREEYINVKSTIIDAVKGEEITEAGSIFYQVEFTDGRDEVVSQFQLFLPSSDYTLS